MQSEKEGGALCFHYYCLPGHLGDFGWCQPIRSTSIPKCSPWKVGGITHSQLTFFYSENVTKIRLQGTHFHQIFQKLQICFNRKGQLFYKQSCSGRKVSLGGLRGPTSNPVLKNLKFGTPWASYGCFGDHLSAFEVEKINRFLQGVDTAVAITEYPTCTTLKTGS